jgi:hypothetical protein
MTDRHGSACRLVRSQTCGGPVDHHGGCAARETRVDAQDDIRIEHGHEGVEVAPARGSEEGVDRRALTSEIAVRNADVCALDASSCTARDLSRRHRGPTDHVGDLLEGQLEQVVEHERPPDARSGTHPAKKTDLALRSPGWWTRSQSRHTRLGRRVPREHRQTAQQQLVGSTDGITSVRSTSRRY